MTKTKELWLIQNGNDHIVGAITAQHGTGVERIEPFIHYMPLLGMKISKHSDYNFMLLDEDTRKKLIKLLQSLEWPEEDRAWLAAVIRVLNG